MNPSNQQAFRSIRAELRGVSFSQGWMRWARRASCPWPRSTACSSLEQAGLPAIGPGRRPCGRAAAPLLKVFFDDFTKRFFNRLASFQQLVDFT
jgi:hypothetical protein